MSEPELLNNHVDNVAKTFPNHNWIVWGTGDYPYVLCAPVEEMSNGRFRVHLYNYTISKEKFETYTTISGSEGIALYRAIRDLANTKYEKQDNMNAELRDIAALTLYKIFNRAIPTGSRVLNAILTDIETKETREKEIKALARRMYIDAGGVDWEFNHTAQQCFVEYARTAFKVLNKE